MTANDLNRREFVRACAVVLASGAEFWRVHRPWMQNTLRIAFVSRNTDAGFLRGVTLGTEEAARTGELVGRSIEMVTVDAADSIASVAAVIGGVDEDECRALAERASASGILFMNVGCRADALRGEGCGRNVFHVEASARMYADALADAAEGDVVLWHPSLERFGAAQLNDRFRARFGGEMDEAAWAGWMAVKALWEASLRARSVDAQALRAYLERPATQFDGHKGWPLSFRAWDHQLRQPLYRVADGRVAAEVPARASGEETPSREMLDRLGADAAASVCRMGEG